MGFVPALKLKCCCCLYEVRTLSGSIPPFFAPRKKKNLFSPEKMQWGWIGTKRNYLFKLDPYEKFFVQLEKNIFLQVWTFPIFHISIQPRSITSFPVDLLLNSIEKLVVREWHEIGGVSNQSDYKNWWHTVSKAKKKMEIFKFTRIGKERGKVQVFLLNFQSFPSHAMLIICTTCF